MSSRPSLSRDSSGGTNASSQTTVSKSSDSTSTSGKPRSHHAKSRRLTAQPVPLKPLAAKSSALVKRWQPLPVTNQDTLLEEAHPLIPVCLVCRQPACQLSTHQKLTARSRKKGKRPANSSPVIDETYKSSYAYRLARTCVYPTLGEGKIDPFYNLPLTGDLDTDHNHRLFHYYFSFETKQGLQVPRPPHVTEDLILNPFFIVAMQDATVCLAVLSLATALYPTNSRLPPDVLGALMYSGQAMRLVRKAMTAGDPPTDEAIVSQGFLWATSIVIFDKPAMLSLAESVHTAIRARGGLRNLGLQGKVEQFIRWVDARYCTVAHVASKYQDVPDISVRLLAKTPPRMYGSFWESPRAAEILSQDVLDSCLGICRLIEVVEETFVTGMTMPTLWYLMGKVLFLMTSRTRVLECYDSTASFNECAISANEIALNFALDDPIKQRNALTCHSEPLVKAIRTIDEQFPQFLEYSYGETELLMWVLFLVVMIPHEFEGKGWARMRLCSVIRNSLAEDGAADWYSRIWDSMSQFTWSNLKNKKLFDDVCSNINHEILMQKV